jgi:hypothetical protein
MVPHHVRRQLQPTPRLRRRLEALFAQRIAILGRRDGLDDQPSKLQVGDLSGTRFPPTRTTSRAKQRPARPHAPRRRHRDPRALLRPPAPTLARPTLHATAISQVPTTRPAPRRRDQHRRRRLRPRRRTRPPEAAHAGPPLLRRRRAVGPHQPHALASRRQPPDYRAVTWAQVVAAYTSRSARSSPPRRRAARRRDHLRHLNAMAPLRRPSRSSTSSASAVPVIGSA